MFISAFCIRVQICTPCIASAYSNKLCPYVPTFDLKFKTRTSVLRRNSLCFDGLSDSNTLLSRCICGCWDADGFFLDISISKAGCAAETFTRRP